jgi:hypothetical protein
MSIKVSYRGKDVLDGGDRRRFVEHGGDEDDDAVVVVVDVEVDIDSDDGLRTRSIVLRD